MRVWQTYNLIERKGQPEAELAPIIASFTATLSATHRLIKVSSLQAYIVSPDQDNLCNYYSYV